MALDDKTCQHRRVATVVRPFRGVSAEDRLAQRRAILLDAGLDEIAAVGVAGLRMRSVCERSGLVRRYFYEQFPNRDDLVLALFDDMMRKIAERMMAETEGVPLDLHTRACVAMDQFLGVFLDDPRLIRLYVEAASSPLLAAARAAAISRSVDFASGHVRAVLGELDEDTRVRIDTAIRVIVIGQADVAMAWLRGEIALSGPDYAELVAHAFVDAISGVHARSTR
ncbi:helix-turn-helix domain-containing protein [Mycobacterium sp. SM3041]|uniref:TetR/AcrR family transcriptional regulator n=1 Tax=Mycobacterium sp. SM3041 TaxID=3114291 RepID=UPI003204FB2F